MGIRFRNTGIMLREPALTRIRALTDIIFTQKDDNQTLTVAETNLSFGIKLLLQEYINFQGMRPAKGGLLYGLNEKGFILEPIRDDLADSTTIAAAFPKQPDVT